MKSNIDQFYPFYTKYKLRYIYKRVRKIYLQQRKERYEEDNCSSHLSSHHVKLVQKSVLVQMSKHVPPTEDISLNEEDSDSAAGSRMVLRMMCMSTAHWGSARTSVIRFFGLSTKDAVKGFIAADELNPIIAALLWNQIIKWQQNLQVTISDNMATAALNKLTNVLRTVKTMKLIFPTWQPKSLMWQRVRGH